LFYGLTIFFKVIGMDRSELFFNKNKIIYVELLRILAIALVLFNHTGSDGYYYYLKCEPGSFFYWFYMSFNILAEISVPLFFTISGMFLLDRQNETIGFILKKRVLKYVIILSVFSLFVYLLINHYQISMDLITGYFRDLYSDTIFYSYWFLYVYIAYLIALPFLRKLARDMNEKEFIYLLVIQFIFNGVVSFIRYVLTGGSLAVNEHLIPEFLINGFVFFPLCGYFLGRKLKKVTNRILLSSFCMFALNMISALYITDMSRRNVIVSTSAVSGLYSSTKAFMVIFVFLLFRRLFDGRKYPSWLESLISCLGGCVFGIYLIGDILRYRFIFVFNALNAKINTFAASWIYILFLIVISWVIVFSFNILFRYIKTSIKKKDKAV